MGFVRDLTGKTAVTAATKAADVQVGAGREASALLDPFKAIGQQGLQQASFLTDPNQQFQYLQDNPLFQSAIQAGDRNVDRLMQSAAARGRLSAGDTAEQLQTVGQQNILSNALPFIQNQQQGIGNLLNYGLTTAGNQGNLLTGQGAAAAGGIIGAANARGQKAKNIFDLGMQGAQAFGFSDPKLKTNIKKVGKQNGFNIYEWTWNKAANTLGLVGDGLGVMADEVQKIMPDAVIKDNSGYMKVNYVKIGVNV